MTHWVELVLLGSIWVSISASFGQAEASEKTAESVVMVITFKVLALQKSTPKRALKKELKKPSQNVPEDPNVTDNSDLESQLGPRGSVAESLFRYLLDPGGPGDPKWCPKWSPKVPKPPKHRF